MKINERALTYFANCNFPTDKEGWLWKKGELNTSYQKRWCVLRGNLLFYFERRYDKDPIGVIVLENCTIQLAQGGDSAYTFSIIFLGEGTRTYKFVADDEESCNEWIKCLSLSSYRYLKILVEELEKSNKSQSSPQSALLIPDSQRPVIPRGLRNAASIEDLTKPKSRLTRKPLSHSNSEKNLAHLIDLNEEPLKIVDHVGGAKTKSFFYPLKSYSDTLLKVEYGGKRKNQVFLTTNKSDVPTFSSACRSFLALHEFFRLCIEDRTSRDNVNDGIALDFGSSLELESVV